MPPKKRSIKLPYVIRRADSPGFHFSRKIPRDIAHHFGRTHWRWKLGETESEARIKLADAIQQTEQVIQDLRAGKEPTRPAQSPDQRLWEDLKRHFAGVDAAQIAADAQFRHLYPDHTEAEAEHLANTIQWDQEGANAVTFQSLFELACRLKNPAPTTKQTWEGVLKQLEDRLGPNANTVSVDQVKAWRDEWLELVNEGKAKKSSLRTKFGIVSGWYVNAIDDNLLKANPFDRVLRNIGSDPKVKTDWLGLARKADELVPTKLNPLDQQLYWIIRWSGMRLAEACGLRIQDVNLKDGYLSVFPYEDGMALRTIKNTQSHRLVPIHHKLRPVLERLVADGAEYPFISKYNPKGHRWGSGLDWTKKVGVSPHKLRHAVHTSLRNHRVDDYTQRVIVGHGSADVHTAYGSQEFQVAFDAVQLID